MHNHDGANHYDYNGGSCAYAHKYDYNGVVCCFYHGDGHNEY